MDSHLQLSLKLLYVDVMEFTVPRIMNVDEGCNGVDEALVYKAGRFAHNRLRVT